MDRVDRLTGRQKDCLQLVGEGYTSKQIGRMLGISSATVDNHIRATLEVLQVTSRAEAARMLVASQRLTSQPAHLADTVEVAAVSAPAEHRSRSWLRGLVPPLGGQRNTLNREHKIFATITVAVISLASVIILVLAASVLLWLTR